jgi:hypothetical protein
VLYLPMTRMMNVEHRHSDAKEMIETEASDGIASGVASTA